MQLKIEKSFLYRDHFHTSGSGECNGGHCGYARVSLYKTMPYCFGCGGIVHIALKDPHCDGLECGWFEKCEQCQMETFIDGCFGNRTIIVDGNIALSGNGRRTCKFCSRTSATDSEQETCRGCGAPL